MKLEIFIKTTYKDSRRQSRPGKIPPDKHITSLDLLDTPPTLHIGHAPNTADQLSRPVGKYHHWRNILADIWDENNHIDILNKLGENNCMEAKQN